MKRYLLCILMILTVSHSYAQEQLSIKQQADKLFDRYEYFKSLGYYLKLANRHNPDVKILQRVAECYRNINQYADAEEWYARAVANVKADKISHYYYAEVLLRNQKLAAAKQQYRLYFVKDTAALVLKIANCDSAAVWMNKPSRYKVDNAGSVNSQYSDWGASYNGKAGLMFTSDRDAEGAGTDNRTGNAWFKLYQSTNRGKATEMYFIDSTGYDLQNNYHLGPIVLNKRADTAYVTATTDLDLKDLVIDPQKSKRGDKLSTRRLQLLMAVKKNGKWIIVNSFPYNNIQQYSIGNAALSPDGKLIYFSSDMPGGEGKTDIWYCQRQANGLWGKPVNCGKTINTKEEDSFPYVDDSGTVYYASKGLPGMGGYDIYSVTGKGSEWTIPQNLKYPVNTTSDDFYMVSHNGLTGYLSSNREGGKGSDDIYSFATATTDTGAINPDPQIAIAPKPIAMEPDYEIKTIYYDRDKSFIRPDAAAELDRLVAVLNRHLQYKVELSSYTDSRASVQYNEALSQRRAKAAVAYLLKHGILLSRMAANGYGKTHFVNACADNVKCTEAEHQLNRRTEFKLIK